METVKVSAVKPFLVWSACALLGGAGLSAIVASLPSEARKLLLFPLAFGLAVGWGVGRLATAFEIPGRWPRGVVAGVICLLGLLNVGRISYARMQAAAAENVQRDPKQLLALDLLAAQADGDAGWSRRYQEERMRLKPTFADYLAARLTQLGIWRPPWPLGVWIGELSVGGAAAAWLAARAVPTSQENDLEGRKES